MIVRGICYRIRLRNRCRIAWLIVIPCRHAYCSTNIIHVAILHGNIIHAATSSDITLQAETERCAFKIYGVPKDVMHVRCIAAYGSTMTSTEGTVPNMNILCALIHNDIIVACAYFAIINIHKACPDRYAICIVRWILAFRIAGTVAEF